MNQRRSRRAAAYAALVFAATPLLGATTPMPPLRSNGTLVVQANVEGSPVNIGGTIALYHKGALYRLDVLSLGFPGTDPNLSALASSLIGPGGVSLLYNGETGQTVAWSTTNRTYYELAPAHAANAPAARPAPATTNGPPSDPLSVLASVAQTLQNVQTASIQLTGHGVVNGHPSTQIDVLLKRQLPGKPLEDYHAQLALADDLNDFPVQLALSSTPASKSAFGGSLKLDLTSVQRDTPADTLFTVPSGYTRASSLSGVLGQAPASR
ncbi:MAG TPA: hypothetical protein VE591_10705 [Candidatus Acidoferrum sp.]|nr:hypothetical protein [Candidatus Acidoferrum sp.]